MLPLIESHRPALENLCRRFGVRRLDLFGSAATGGFDAARSDLDFLVQFESGTPSEHSRRYFGLLAALQDLFGRRIDLVEPQTVTNPFVKRGIEESLVQLYAA